MYFSTGPKTQTVVSYEGDRDRALSPSRAKISQLTEKLSNLQHSINKDQAKETFEQQIKILEDKATKQQQSDESKLKLLKEQISKVENKIKKSLEKYIIVSQINFYYSLE